MPDGKVKIYLTKKASNVPVGQNIPQVISQSQSAQQVPPVNQQPIAQNSSPVVGQQTSSAVIDSSTNVLDMSGFTIPSIDSNDKHVLKVICNQIRKSPIEIPIREDIETFAHFSSYIISILGLNKELKAILFNETGCPYVNSLDLYFMNFPKIDYSKVHYIVFTKTPSVCDTVSVAPMETKASPQMIRITKPSVLNPLDIKFEIDLSNTLSVLKYKVFELSKIHPSNQILKFGNTVLANDLETLATYGIQKDSIVELQFKATSNSVPSTPCDKFFYKDVKLINEQSEIANECLRANLIVLSQHIADDDKNKFCAAVERYTADMPLVYAFKSLFRGTLISQPSRIALEEGLFSSILNFFKSLKTVPAIKTDEVFSYIRNFLGFIIESTTKITDLEKVKAHSNAITLQNLCYLTLKPIKNPALLKLDYGVTVVVDREASEEQIDKGLTFDHYKKPSKADLKSTSEFEEAWSLFLTNHLDNDEYETLFWSGFNSETDEFKLPEANC